MIVGLPSNIQSVIEEFSKTNQFNTHRKVNFYLLNYNAKDFKNSFLVDKNMSRVRLNFAPHAYLYPSVRNGEDVKNNVACCIYTQENGAFIHSSLRGVDDCTDFGRISINSGNFFTKANLLEVHVHPADNENMAVSPNNGAFLLNLTFPVVNFYVVISTLGSSQCLSIFK
jgi:hypothetical protein